MKLESLKLAHFVIDVLIRAVINVDAESGSFGSPSEVQLIYKAVNTVQSTDMR